MPTTPTMPTSTNTTTPTPVHEASPLQIRQWLDQGDAILVDVREPDEHAREHIQGSTLIPLSRFDPERVRALVAPGKRLVMHCRGGRRGADAARIAASHCGRDVEIANMSGGIEAWKHEKLPVQVNTKVSSISVMRQVQLTIGVGVLTGAALGWFVHPGFMAIPAFFGAGLLFAGVTGTCGLAALLGVMPWNRASVVCRSTGPDGGCTHGA